MVQERRQVREKAEAVCDLFMCVWPSCAPVKLYIQFHWNLVYIAIMSSTGTKRKANAGFYLESNHNITFIGGTLSGNDFRPLVVAPEPFVLINTL